jgi:hypothetical protein
MAWRDLMVKNLRWKLGALIMAVFVWFIIQFAISKGIKPSDHPLSEGRTQTFSQQPVLVMTTPGDARAIRINPSKVDVIVRSTASVLNKLNESDIKAFVKLAGPPDPQKTTNAVFVFVPTRAEIYEIQVSPSTVTVESTSQPGSQMPKQP